MRTAVSVVLATALVTTPLKQVLAQAAHQEAATAQQTRWWKSLHGINR